MRYIKFRGKDKRTGEWVYGYYVMNNLLLPEKGESINKHFIIDGIGQKNEVIPETVGQFVEVNDKNNREVYEGDIVKMSDWQGNVWLCVVVFLEGSFKLKLVRIIKNVSGESGVKYADVWYARQQGEVVGNIYDNPELLEEGVRDE